MKPWLQTIVHTTELGARFLFQDWSVGGIFDRQKVENMPVNNPQYITAVSVTSTPSSAGQLTRRDWSPGSQATAALFPATFITTYGIAVSLGHADSLWPYISDTGISHAAVSCCHVHHSQALSRLRVAYLDSSWILEPFFLVFYFTSSTNRLTFLICVKCYHLMLISSRWQTFILHILGRNI